MIDDVIKLPDDVMSQRVIPNQDQHFPLFNNNHVPTMTSLHTSRRFDIPLGCWPPMMSLHQFGLPLSPVPYYGTTSRDHSTSIYESCDNSLPNQSDATPKESCDVTSAGLDSKKISSERAKSEKLLSSFSMESILR